MKDYRITVKVRNNRILKAIEEAGGSPGQKWCSTNGLSYHYVNDFINMAISPITSEGAITPAAEQLCYVLGKMPDDLWSNEQLYPLERNFSEMEMSHEQVMAMLPSEQQSYLPDYSDIENEQIKKLVDNALNKLTKKEQDVIRMRFDMDLSLETCGERLNVGKERIRQIEAKALRKLRHPHLAGLLVDAVDRYDTETRAKLKQQAKECWQQQSSVSKQ